MEKTKTVAIYGKSGHGSVLEDIALASGYDTIVWIDQRGVEGSVSWEYFSKNYQGIPVALGIGNNQIRAKIMKEILEGGFQAATLIHPSAVISQSAQIGSGSVVMPLSVINAHAKIGQGVIVNSGSVIEHDCVLEDFVHISPKAALAGGVRVGEFTHIGIGSQVIQLLRVGSSCIIGSGSNIVSDIPDHVQAFGNPCKIKKELKHD